MVSQGHTNAASAMALAVWCALTAVTAGDCVLLEFTGVPAHGLVVARADLTAVARRAGLAGTAPAGLSAVCSRTGESVPFQFVSCGDRNRLAGYIVTRLSADGPHQLRLTTRPGKAPAAAWRGIVTNRHYHVTHSADRMGGLPSAFFFPATGKRFENFRWQDRLYHGERRGFELRHDKAASCQRVSAGPLCTAVRVRAGYVRGDGTAPAFSPGAVYHWLYFDDLPWIYVAAEATQSSPLEWHELHFLELNFPGKDFTRWLGGQPSSGGDFQGEKTSHQLSDWGAVFDGHNAIAMLDCGRLAIYDGAEGYGSYLHAHGPRAWQPWTDTRRAFSAWLWIGSTENPGARVERWLGKLPTDARVTVTTTDLRAALAAPVAVPAWQKMAAERLEAAGQIDKALAVAQGSMPAGWVTATAGDLHLVLEKGQDGLRLASLGDTRAGRQLLAPESLALFDVTLRRKGTREAATLTADRGWGSVELCRGDLPGQRVVTLSAPTDERFAGVSVRVTLTPDSAASAFLWDLRVGNENLEWGLWRVVFPQVAVARQGETAGVFVPHGSGVVRQDLWHGTRSAGGTYPNGWTAMQYLAAYGSGTGLYVGMHDPTGSTKDIRVEGLGTGRGVAFRYDHPVPNMGRPALSFDLPGTAVWRRLRGDWYDAAMIYREWVTREAGWWPRLGPEGRGDTPLWMRELPAWAQAGGPTNACVAPVKAFAEALGVPVGFHWYNWHRIPFDNDYPHYFPPKAGFRAAVADLERSGVHVMPYINGRLWDTRDRGTNDVSFTPRARNAATKDESGAPYTESYSSRESDGSAVKLAAMCPVTPLWRQTLLGIVARLLEDFGVSGVYIDQVAAAKPRLCFDAVHGHPLGGGPWWVDGYRRMLSSMRASMPPGRMLTTECNAEPYLKAFDGYLTWHWQEQDAVPAFPAVYGGAIQMFGRAYRGGPTQDLANRMKAGQQLVYGEQLGWLNPGAMRRADTWPFFCSAVRLRWELRRFFYAGRMARPPALIGNIPSVTADWKWRDTWPVKTAAVMGGAWRLPREKKVALLLANVSDRDILLKLGLHAEEYGLLGSDPPDVTAVVPEGSKVPPAMVFDSSVSSEISLPARSVYGWVIAPRPEGSVRPE